jgi:hypothetical protein
MSAGELILALQRPHISVPPVEMRRDAIYPHRSVRFLHLTAVRLLTALAFAVALTGGMYAERNRILVEHTRISNQLLRLCGIPLTGVTTVDVFGKMAASEITITSVFHYRNDPKRVAVLFISSVIVLLAVHRRVELARNFVLFLGVLLLVAAGVMIFSQSFEIESGEFTQIWLRQEVLVWLLLPWLSSALFVLLHPDLRWGVLWALLVQGYAVVWSAVRLAFGVAVIHYSGLLFVPLLWFGLGLLADNIYLLVFFSLSIRQSAGKTWGRRVSWRF